MLLKPPWNLKTSLRTFYYLRTDKWEGEDEEDDIKDAWDAESDEDKSESKEE